MGYLVIGRATFINKLCTNRYLEEEDFGSYGYDTLNDHFFFEGENHEIEYEILDLLLVRRIKNI